MGVGDWINEKLGITAGKLTSDFDRACAGTELANRNIINDPSNTREVNNGMNTLAGGGAAQQAVRAEIVQACAGPKR